MKNPVRSFIFVLIYTFILLELGLFLSGKFVLWQRREKSGNSTGVRLVCIGDSHTFGVGTSAPYSYPKQLEKLLNANNPGKKFSITNLGVPGSSTRSQAAELESFFIKDRADLVLWLTGRNNTEEDLKIWKAKVSAHKIQGFSDRLKSVRFLRWAFTLLSRKDPSLEVRGPQAASPIYTDYLNDHLNTVRRLCEVHGAKLILLSYYNSTDATILGFADKYRIPCFDLTGAFSLFFRGKDPSQYISPDNSHMNRLGYQFYSECLYKDMFLSQKRLGLKLSPLLQKPKVTDFYLSQSEIEECIRSQQQRVEQSRGTWAYAFEKIQLGHIYSELGREDSAKQCFMEGLVSSGYGDNNMLVSPIVTWYLKRGRRQEALKLCDEILVHNPKNEIAQNYRERLSVKPA